MNNRVIIYITEGCLLLKRPAFMLLAGVFLGDITLSKTLVSPPSRSVLLSTYAFSAQRLNPEEREDVWPISVMLWQSSRCIRAV